MYSCPDAFQVLLKFGCPPNYQVPLHAERGTYDVSSLRTDESRLRCKCLDSGFKRWTKDNVLIERDSQEVTDQKREDFAADLVRRRKNGEFVEPLTKFNDNFLVYILLCEFGVELRARQTICILKCLRGVLSLLRDDGIYDVREPDRARECVDLVVIPYIRYHLKFDYLPYIQYVKWWTTNLLAKHLGQDLETPPFADADPFFGIRGGVRRLLRNVVKYRPTRRSFHFLCGLQQLKRAAEVVPSDFLSHAYVKHAKAMRNEPSSTFSTGHLAIRSATFANRSKGFTILAKRGLHNTRTGFRLHGRQSESQGLQTDPELYLQRFRQKVKQILDGFEPDLFGKYSTSTSACWERSRSSGGQNAAILETLGHRHRMPPCALRSFHNWTTNDKTNDLRKVDERKGIYNSHIKYSRFIPNDEHPSHDQFAYGELNCPGNLKYPLEFHKSDAVALNDEFRLNIANTSFFHCQSIDVHPGFSFQMYRVPFSGFTPEHEGYFVKRWFCDGHGDEYKRCNKGSECRMQLAELLCQPRVESGLYYDGKHGHRRRSTKDALKKCGPSKVLCNEFGNLHVYDKYGNPVFESRLDPWTHDATLKSVWSEIPYPLIGSPIDPSSSSIHEPGELLQMCDNPRVDVWEVRGYPLPDMCQLNSDFHSKQPKFEWTRSRVIPFSTLRGNSFAAPDRYRPVLDAMVAGVCEPFKVRPVTKGPSFPYWISKSYQQSIHHYIKRFPQFNLAGKPLESSDFRDLLRMTPLDVSGPESDKTGWVSGDYSAATDNVDIRLTEICHAVAMAQTRKAHQLGRIECSDLDLEQMIKTLNSTIEPHVIHYPKRELTDDDYETILGMCDDPESFSSGISQQNGQLMGSPLSFPYLCIINFAVSWEAVFPHISDFRNVPIYVNGDDIIFKTDEAGYRRWKDAISDAGFILSVGKNFFHPRFLFINSQPWIHRREYKLDSGGAPVGSFERFDYVPFFNQGLMSGQSKVGDKSGKPFMSHLQPRNQYDIDYAPLYALHKGAILGASNTENALAEFYHRNKAHLNLVSVDGFFSFHAPVEYGGLGMVPGKRDKLTISQRRVAKVAQSHALEGFEFRRPECLDDFERPYFTDPDQGIARQMVRSSRRGLYCRDQPTVKYLTPYVTNFANEPISVDFNRRSRCCESSRIKAYYSRKLRRDKKREIKPIPSRFVHLGFTIVGPDSTRLYRESSFRRKCRALKIHPINFDRDLHGRSGIDVTQYIGSLWSDDGSSRGSEISDHDQHDRDDDERWQLDLDNIDAGMEAYMR
jgi:hypothetical protein